jgi:hypothetical protein
VLERHAEGDGPWETTGKIEAFISFYALPSTVCDPCITDGPVQSRGMDDGSDRCLAAEIDSDASSTSTHPYKIINAAYLFYYAAQDDNQLGRLVNAALKKAHNLGFHVFNCLDILRNESFLRNLKFSEGDGTLNYYLYNWKTQQISPGDCAVMML